MLAGMSEDLFETSRRLSSGLVECLSFLREVCACCQGANTFMTEVLSEEDRGLPGGGFSEAEQPAVCRWEAGPRPTGFQSSVGAGRGEAASAL